MMKFKNRILSLFIIITFMIAIFCMQNFNVYANVYRGVDIYEYSNITDYQVLKNNGISVVIQKASQGFRRDGLLSYRANMLNQYDFNVGYYCYANNLSYQSPEAQAQYFLQQVQGLKHNVILFLDIENEDEWTKSQAINFTNRFINYIQSKGEKIGIYTGLSFYYDFLSGNVQNVPLWLASYGKQPKQFPNMVSWQYSENASINGISEGCDADYFNDSIFTGQAPISNSISIQPQVNNSVLTIQRQLNYVINAKLVEDGIYGDSTRNAILSFQQKYNLQCDAIWGTQCVNKINELYGINKQNSTTQAVSSNEYYNGYNMSKVKSLQHLINGLGLANLSTDGKLGTQTLNAMRRLPVAQLHNYHNDAYTDWLEVQLEQNPDHYFGTIMDSKVRNFQRQSGLVVDGKVGFNTLKELLK